MSGDIRPERPAALAVGLLRPCILAHLIGGQSVYGYELHHWLLGIGVECDLGTVYRSLNTMEAEGLLHSTWERTAGGRSRRRYELNDAGLDMIDAYVGAGRATARASLRNSSRCARQPVGALRIERPIRATSNRRAPRLSRVTNAPLSIPARRG